MKKFFLILVLLIPVLFTSTGCDPNKNGGYDCDEIAMYCDIASTMIAATIPYGGIIEICKPFIVKGVVTNLEYRGKCKDSRTNPTSKETHTGYQVQYYTGNKSSDNDGWETIDFIDSEGNTTELLSIYTQSLLANQDANINNTYEFEVAGQYRFIQNADHKNEEPNERDEENNGKTSEDTELDGSGKNVRNSVVVIDVKDPEGKGKKLKAGELPTVKYIGTEITYKMHSNTNEQ